METIPENISPALSGLNKVVKEGWNWKDAAGNINYSEGYIFTSSSLRWMTLGHSILNEVGVNLEVELPEYLFPALTVMVVDLGP